MVKNSSPLPSKVRCFLFQNDLDAFSLSCRMVVADDGVTGKSADRLSDNRSIFPSRASATMRLSLHDAWLVQIYLRQYKHRQTPNVTPFDVVGVIINLRSVAVNWSSWSGKHGVSGHTALFCWLIGVAVNLVSVAGVVVTFLDTNVFSLISVSYFRSWPVGAPRYIALHRRFEFHGAPVSMLCLGVWYCTETFFPAIKEVEGQNHTAATEMYSICALRLPHRVRKTPSPKRSVP